MICSLSLLARLDNRGVAADLADARPDEEAAGGAAWGLLQRESLGAPGRRSHCRGAQGTHQGVRVCVCVCAWLYVYVLVCVRACECAGECVGECMV